jgi:O-antigen ligase
MAGALAIAPFVFVNGSFDPANLPQSAWVQVWGLGLAAWALARAARIGSSPADLPLALLVAWGAASLAWATSRGDAVPVLLQWIACGAWFVAVSRTITEPSAGRVLAVALFASGAAVALIGLAQYFFGLTVFYQAFPPASTFVNKNIAAQYVVGTLPLGLAVRPAWRTPVRTGVGVAIVAAAVLMTVFLVVARTRSAWVAAVVEIAVVCWLIVPDRRRSTRVLLVVAATVVAAALAWAGASRPAMPATGDATPPAFTSVQARRAIWLNTTAMIADAPLRGVGLGNHAVHYPAYARRVAVDPVFSAQRQLDHVHNDPLQLAAETGLVGLALAAWVALRGLGLWRVAARDHASSPLLAAWLAAAAGLAADSLFSFPMQRALPPVMLAVGLGTVAGLAGLRSGRGVAPARLLAATAAVAAILVGVHRCRALEADRHLGAMIGAEGHDDWRGVRDEAEAALRLTPADPLALFGLGAAELSRGRIPEARAAFRRLLVEHPHDLPALGNLALAEMAEGNDAGALEAWDRVLALDPRDPRAQAGRAAVLARIAAPTRRSN